MIMAGGEKMNFENLFQNYDKLIQHMRDAGYAESYISLLKTEINWLQKNGETVDFCLQKPDVAIRISGIFHVLNKLIVVLKQVFKVHFFTSCPNLIRVGDEIKFQLIFSETAQLCGVPMESLDFIKVWISKSMRLLLPFILPTTFETAILGGIETYICT